MKINAYVSDISTKKRK